MKQAITFSYTSLDELRNTLLDLTNRNRLLNYPNKAKSLYLANLDANKIASELLAGNLIDFVPVPKPTKEELEKLSKEELEKLTNDKKDKLEEPPKDESENLTLPSIPKIKSEKWAEKLGYTKECLFKDPQNNQSNISLNTFLYAEDLDARLKSISRENQTSIEETGNGILYLTIGFLEWYEADSSNIAHSAPLFNIPLQIIKEKRFRQGNFTYTISLSEEGISTNITLREKLDKQFGLILPEINDDLLPEQYFTQIQELILVHQPRWKLTPKACISLLNFKKQAMYLDLDPTNWQNANIKLEDHPIISQLFSLEGKENIEINNIEEYNIDKLPEVHQKFPLVAEADSSQHSALIDAVKGHNLIIEGPPGSGKSQTITNLIAALLNNGKKVLFVAEKMAALEVVKNRLDNVGLGQFCLEIHSHKANKTEIIKDLAQQLEKSHSYDTTILEIEIQNYEDIKQRLSNYANLINKTWKDSGKTIHQILTKVSNLKQLIPETILEDFSNQKLDRIKINDLKEKSRMLSEIYQQIAKQSSNNDIYQHPWYGVNKTSVDEREEKELINSLSDWNNSLKEIFSLLQNILNNHIELEDITFEEIVILAKDISNLPNIDGLIDEEKENYFSHFSELQTLDKLENLVACLNDYKNTHEKFDELSSIFQENVLNEPEKYNQIDKNLLLLNTLTSHSNDTLEKLSKYKNDIRILIEKFSTSLQQIAEIKSHLPDTLCQEINESEFGLLAFIKIIEFIEKLPPNLWKKRNSLFARNIENNIKDLEKLTNKKQDYFNKLNSIFNLSQLPNTEKLVELSSILEKNQGFFSFFSKNYRLAKKQILELLQPGVNKNISIPILPNLIEYQRISEKIEKYIKEEPELSLFYQNGNIDIVSLSTLNTWYKNIYNEYGKNFGKRVIIGQSLIDLDENIAHSLQIEGSLLKNTIINCLEQLNLFKTYFSVFFNKETQINLGENSILLKLYEPLNSILLSLENEIKDGLIPIKNLQHSLPLLQEIINKTHSNKIIANQYNLSFNFGDFEYDKLVSLEKIVDFIKSIKTNKFIYQILKDSPTIEKYNKILNLGKKLTEIQKENLVEKREKNFQSIANLEFYEWKRFDDNLSLKKLIERNDFAMNNITYLGSWCDFIDFKHIVSNNSFQSTLLSLITHKLEPKYIQNSVELSIYSHLAKEILNSNEILNSTHGFSQESLIKRFRDCDIKLMLEQRKQIAFNASNNFIPTGIGSGLKSDYTERSLIIHEASKQKRHISIRNLLARAPQSIQTLKPCFMMSPMSVAQYLQPGKFEFDVVIMDEASQIRPQDAISAIARGKSTVIVGDPKQLPPTNFFQAASTESEEDSLAITDSESILESVSSMFKTRRLRWHYRSQHESLIAFSNHAFYDSNLIIFPSPKEKSDEVGVHFTKVNGIFNQSINHIEVNKIVDELIKLIQQGGESLGVIAMNSAQQAEIETALELKLQKNPELQKLFDQKEIEHQLFIKNLENVQGDERDVILISMTYGPEPATGKVYPRFGPINQHTGWRRLNVLLTRAKKRMHIFSSMSSYDIIVSETSSRGVRALRDFLEYCEKGYLPIHTITGKSADSDFEIAVMRALKEHNYDCEPQLGVAGFFLDLAVRNPNNPTQFLLGIECDGASYHSAKSARDRDRLRQEILENLGWKIHRIWSTDWFKRPQEQIQRVLEVLSNLVEQSKSQETKGVSLEFQHSIKSAQESFSFENNEEKDNKGQNSGLNISHIPKIKKNSTPNLEIRLTELANEIREKYPNIPEHRHLLRPVIMDILLNKKPINKEEFVEFVPKYYRESIDPLEGESRKYLEKILKIIEDDS